MPLEFTRDELRQLEQLISAAEGRFPDAFYSAGEKIAIALKAPLRAFAETKPLLSDGERTMLKQTRGFSGDEWNTQQHIVRRLLDLIDRLSGGPQPTIERKEPA